MYHHVCHGQNMVYVIYCDMVIPPTMWMLKMARTVYKNSMKMDWSPIPQWLGVYCNPTNLIMAHILVVHWKLTLTPPVFSSPCSGNRTTNILIQLASGTETCLGNLRTRRWENSRQKWQYPLVNIQKTMENHHVQWVNPLFLWAMFQFANCKRLPGRV